MSATCYRDAGRVLHEARSGRGTVRKLVLSDRNLRDKKKVMALASETLRFVKVIDSVFREAGFAPKKERRSRAGAVLFVLAYELLLGKQRIEGGGRLSRRVREAETQLRAALTAVTQKAGVASANDLTDAKKEVVSLPRYARVNLLLTTSADVQRILMAEGVRFLAHPPAQGCSDTAASSEGARASGPASSSNTSHISTTDDGPSSDVESAEITVYWDPDVPDLIVFPPGTELHDHPLVERGHLVLQDKASCLPALCASLQEGDVVVDACAAPGNKTHHAACLLPGGGTIHAVDRDDERCAILRERMKLLGASRVRTHHADFLSPSESLQRALANCTVVIADPSCSGSGIASREQREQLSQQRLRSLQAFQLRILCAAAALPRVRTIVYSTCSIYRKENEDVVERFLAQYAELGWSLATALPSFPARGLLRETVRCGPEQTATIGFFVARLEKNDVSADAEALS